MIDKILRKRLLRLAHDNPGKIRDALMPLLAPASKQSGKSRWKSTPTGWSAKEGPYSFDILEIPGPFNSVSFQVTMTAKGDSKLPEGAYQYIKKPNDRKPLMRVVNNLLKALLSPDGSVILSGWSRK
jgi:hypothetical protein